MPEPLTAEQVGEALACGIGSMRERESLGILPQRYAEAQSILRRLIESGFVEATIECEELWRGDYRNSRDPGEMQKRLNDARSNVATCYRRLQAGKGE